ncbi:hypothetical protein [Nosocomiicoccus ampullae]|uniref:hypothetical protein n=1 Tax=Nosocomiicoccus ampullae TaxID=489910 RepID=UPI001C5EB000|nr:hypothetical protein [Nosocomiicoccus ampullae]QYA48700.1 hypothetical protein KPF52_01265 [Nosocomiicoccus ampullae]
MFEWVKLGVTIIFIILMVIVFFTKKNVLNWLIILLILHSIIIFSLRFFIGNEPLVDSILSVVYFVIITIFAVLILKALKLNDE